MKFTFFKKVKIIVNKGRGQIDHSAVIDALVEAWEELEDAINSLDEESQNQIRDYFNSVIEDENDLGDILFGDSESFD